MTWVSVGSLTRMFISLTAKLVKLVVMQGSITLTLKLSCSEWAIVVVYVKSVNSWKEAEIVKVYSMPSMFFPARARLFDSISTKLDALIWSMNDAAAPKFWPRVRVYSQRGD